MSVESVFKSTHPDVLAEHARFIADAEAQRAYAKALAERYGGRAPLRLHSSGGLRIVGLSVTDDDLRRRDRTHSSMPALRLGAKEGYWCPDRRTAEGRALAKEWAEQKAAKPDYLGMPDEVWTESSGFRSYIYHPGSTVIDGAVYVTWGCGADRLIEGPGKADKVDLTVWEHVRLSEWHTLMEDREDAKSGASA